MIKAPWSDVLVKELNRYQQSGYFHPYTCGNDSRHRELLATVGGWICLDCDYRQDWAHEISREVLDAIDEMMQQND